MPPLTTCIDCGTHTQNRRCPPCQRRHNQARDAARGNTTQRGLGAAHRAQVKALIAAQGKPTQCPRCGRPITPGNPITGQHSVARVHGGNVVDELICRTCNSADGATIRKQK